MKYEDYEDITDKEKIIISLFGAISAFVLIGILMYLGVFE